MSYILDSLKKSEKERNSSGHPAAGVIIPPAFIENEKKSPLNNYRVWLLCFLLLVTAIVAYWSFVQPSPSVIGSLPSESKNNSALADKQKTEVITKEPETSAIVPLPTKQPIKVDDKAEKARAIALYQQSIRQKKRESITSLYDKDRGEPQEQTANPATTSSGAKIQLTAAQVAAEQNDEEFESTTPPVKTENAEAVSDRAEIPTLYDLDIMVKKQIPPIDYGAHIYATDHKSGFVILNGARRRQGDQLRSGIFIERIDEESVVLSFKGTVFSLPAMRSWSNN